MKRQVLFLVFLAAAVPAVAADPFEQLAEALTFQAEGKVDPPKLAVLTFKCEEGVAQKDGRAAARALAEQLKSLGRLDVLAGNDEAKKALDFVFQSKDGPDFEEVARMGKALGVGGVVTGELEPEPDGGVVVHARIIRVSPFAVVAGASWRVPWASRNDFSFRPVNRAVDRSDGFSMSGPTFSFNAGIASRTDDFRWNIALDPTGTQTPNILSELTWKDIRIEELRLEGEMEALRMSFQGFFSVGRIVGGSNQDSDYLGDNRTYEFSRSNNSADTGRTQDYRFSIGLPLGDPKQGRLTPRLGWAQATERLFMTNGDQTVSNDYGIPGLVGQLPPTGPFGGLNSHYEHQWRGVLLGVDGRTRVASRFELAGAFRYYPQLSYLADGDWNLRDDLAQPKSFEDRTNGNGWDLDLSVFYDISDGMDAGVEMGWRRWRANAGTDQTFYSDGTSDETRLNEVVWNSYSLQFAFRFRPTDLGPEQN